MPVLLMSLLGGCNGWFDTGSKKETGSEGDSGKKPVAETLVKTSVKTSEYSVAQPRIDLATRIREHALTKYLNHCGQSFLKPIIGGCGNSRVSKFEEYSPLVELAQQAFIMLNPAGGMDIDGKLGNKKLQAQTKALKIEMGIGNNSSSGLLNRDALGALALRLEHPIDEVITLLGNMSGGHYPQGELFYSAAQYIDPKGAKIYSEYSTTYSNSTTLDVLKRRGYTSTNNLVSDDNRENLITDLCNRREKMAEFKETQKPVACNVDNGPVAKTNN